MIKVLLAMLVVAIVTYKPKERYSSEIVKDLCEYCDYKN